MDAKTRSLLALAAGSLFLAGFAWVEDHAVFGSVFFAFGTVAVLAAAWWRWP
jgi:drug/metabolite transporter superfamily protein YnfA